MQSDFWQKLDLLVQESEIRVDRPRGSAHPRYPADIYPLDYGYLEGTVSGDGQDIDVWKGSLPKGGVTGIICTIDTEKRDAEIKILVGCTAQEMRSALDWHNSGEQAAILIERP